MPKKKTKPRKSKSKRIVQRWDHKDHRGKTHTIYVKADGSVSLKTYDGFYQKLAWYAPKSVRQAKQLMKTYDLVPLSAWKLRK